MISSPAEKRFSLPFLVVIAGLLTGCGGSEEETDQQSNETTEEVLAEGEASSEDDLWAEDGTSEVDGPVFVNLEEINSFIRNIGSNVQHQGEAWQFRFRGHPVFVIADTSADRIRIQVPVVESAKLEPADWRRVMSANFDTAIDARYAAAQDILWSVFVHRFSTLTREDFVSGLRQSLNLMATYGTAYASMDRAFSGGDLANPGGGDYSKNPDQD